MEIGIFGLILLFANIYAAYQVWTSGSTNTAEKLIWTLVIFALPLIGLLVWLLAGPRGRNVTA